MTPNSQLWSICDLLVWCISASLSTSGSNFNTFNEHLCVLVTFETYFIFVIACHRGLGGRWSGRRLFRREMSVKDGFRESVSTVMWNHSQNTLYEALWLFKTHLYSIYSQSFPRLSDIMLILFSCIIARAILFLVHVRNNETAHVLFILQNDCNITYRPIKEDMIHHPELFFVYTIKSRHTFIKERSLYLTMTIVR